MKEVLISLETAKLITKNDFDVLCEYGYGQCNDGTDSDPFVLNDIVKTYPAPTQSLLQKWLREKYHIAVEVAQMGIENFFPMNWILEIGGLKGIRMHKKYKTYEEALEVGLYEALKYIIDAWNKE